MYHFSYEISAQVRFYKEGPVLLFGLLMFRKPAYYDGKVLFVKYLVKLSPNRLVYTFYISLSSLTLHKDFPVMKT